MNVRLIDNVTGEVVPPRDREALTQKEAQRITHCQLAWRACKRDEQERIAALDRIARARLRAMGESLLAIALCAVSVYCVYHWPMQRLVLLGQIGALILGVWALGLALSERGEVDR